MNEQMIETICAALSGKKAQDIGIINISSLTVIADYFILCSATSTTQVKTLSDAVEEELEKLNIFVERKEGYHEGRWIVLDYGSVIVHLFLKEEREFYNIEKLWIDGNNYTPYED